MGSTFWEGEVWSVVGSFNSGAFRFIVCQPCRKEHSFWKQRKRGEQDSPTDWLPCSTKMLLLHGPVGSLSVFSGLQLISTCLKSVSVPRNKKARKAKGDKAEWEWRVILLREHQSEDILHARPQAVKPSLACCVFPCRRYLRGIGSSKVALMLILCEIKNLIKQRCDWPIIYLPHFFCAWGPS